MCRDARRYARPAGTPTRFPAVVSFYHQNIRIICFRSDDIYDHFASVRSGVRRFGKNNLFERTKLIHKHGSHRDSSEDDLVNAQSVVSDVSLCPFQIQSAPLSSPCRLSY